MINTSALKSMKEKALSTAIRFPLPLLIAAIAACCLTWLIDAKEKDPYFYNVLHGVITLSLALPAFIGLRFFAERGNHSIGIQLLGQAILLGLGVWYYHSIPVSLGEADAAKYVILSLSMHLWVAFAPFVRYREIQGFWQYNKSLFIRFLTSVLYSGVLFVGLSLAIFAVDQLFDVRMDNDVYARLWILIATIFNTWFFLSDLPENLEALNNSDAYPNGLRLFTQFVLLPLVTIYLSILYVYMFKIILTSNWPKGWVSYLVIGFSTAGILALLLVWPLQSNDRFKWIKVYVKYFFLALFPLIMMLGFAIYIRVRDYGITENRYFIIVLAIWLFGNALYFLISEIKNIKVIPMSLFFVALLSGFGSMNAFTVSKNSQSKRLLSIAAKYRMLEKGKVVPIKSNVSMADSDLIELSNITYYLVTSHGPEAIQPLVAWDVDSLFTNSGRYNAAQSIVSSWNLKYKNYNESSSEPTTSFSYEKASEPSVLTVEGYSFYFSQQFYGNSGDFEKTLALDSNLDLSIRFNEKNFYLTMQAEKQPEIILNLRDLFRNLYTKYSDTNSSVYPEDMTIVKENEAIKCKVVFKNFNGKFKSKDEIEEVYSFKIEVLCQSKIKTSE